ncbi:MAG: cytochrome c oxidase accessory protein CcoG [Bacteroidetes bacterium]|nr:cytochrome c oxidase accessory protein CcoG [Bacteroidota bacterium]MBS1931218.1 cytochrome c oxidase accessory protein CcoG [Bacteroidota bacterium]
MEEKDFSAIAEEKKELIDQSFRDSVATISKQGNRNYIFPKKPKGKLYNFRTITSVFYLIIFFTLPFIKVEGEPLFLFNVLQRKFIFFGKIFWPQDFFIFAIGLLTFIVFIILFTVVFGRVFCGWACPQTIFMEMVFRKIEYLLDGDYNKQRRLKAMPWTAYKIRKRLIKITVFYFVSFIIANFFLAYIIGMDEVLAMVREGVDANIGTFISLLGFTTVFFFVYYWFREQVCIVVCPYGRLQGVLLDKKSIVVAYDYVRGEPRGKIKKEKEGKWDTGDCVDCTACVRVCPTGIDIRNGTQLECVNCTACIDACDDIMDKVNRPRGLIRFASEENIAQKKKTRFTFRIGAYSFALILLVGALAAMLITREDVDARILRSSGQMFQSLPDGRVANLYNLKLTNKTRKDIPVSLKLENIKGEIEVISKDLTVPKESYFQTSFIIKINRQLIEKRKTPITLGIYQADKKIKTLTVTFLGPGY